MNKRWLSALVASLCAGIVLAGVWMILSAPLPARAAMPADAIHASAAAHTRVLSSTAADMAAPGTQPNAVFGSPGYITDGLGTRGTPVLPMSCAACHVVTITGVSDEAGTGGWNGSMMGNAGRDPYFRAALAIADTQIGGAASFCGRCHMPGNWVRDEARLSENRVQSFTTADIDQGVSCLVCHRMVATTALAGEAPRDADERAAVPTAGIRLANAQNIYDRQDYRRGPFEVEAYHSWQQSSLLLSAQLCGGCHDVSNPMLSRGENGEYGLNALDNPAPVTATLFPLQRTYSEWALSAFNSMTGVVEVAGLYPGLKRIDDTATGAVTVCQDCHMPRFEGVLVKLPDYPTRYVANHSLYGGSHPDMADLLGAIWTGYDAEFTPVKQTQMRIAASEGFTNLRSAGVSVAATLGDGLAVTVTNNAGHKFPTGYEEGRRAWLRVEQVDALSGRSLFTSGLYSPGTGRILSGTGDTAPRVYEVKNAVGITLAAQLGRPELAGPGFNQVLNNEVYRDTRIPPRGFANAPFAAAQAEPVGAVYADGQYWDSASYPVAACASAITVSVMYQQISGEYADFLAVQANFIVTDAVRGPTNWGALLAGRWMPPEVLASAVVVRSDDDAGCPLRRWWLPIMAR